MRSKPFVLACFSFLTLLSGCPFPPLKTAPPPVLSGGDPGPSPPATPEDPKPQPAYYEHSFHLNWSYEDLDALREISVESPAAIEAEGTDSDRLFSVVITIRAETAKHEQIAADFEQALESASSLDGVDPVVRPPEPSCDESGRYLKGVCLEPIQIRIPREPKIDLSLSWKSAARIEGARLSRLRLNLPPGGIGRVLDTEGDIELRGGGPDTELIIDHAGNVDAQLESVGDLILERVSGNFTLSVERPGPATAIRWNGRWMNAGGLW